jgi:hypothetical protein
MPETTAHPRITTSTRLAVGLLAGLAAGFAQTGWALADAAGAAAAVPAAPPEAAVEGAPIEVTGTPKPSKMTPEQIQAAIAEANKRRLEESKPDPAISEAVAARLAEQWGVEVIGIRLTSAGYMMDFRFRVVDADKALPLFDHRIKPFVLAEKSEIKLPVPMAPKVGAFRPTNRGQNIKADKTYYMVFGNPDSYVKAGEKVSVVIGDFRAENLTVQ